ncbi:unnamed protein product [Prunus armeniaca]
MVPLKTQSFLNIEGVALKNFPRHYNFGGHLLELPRHQPLNTLNLEDKTSMKVISCDMMARYWKNASNRACAGRIFEIGHVLEGYLK